MDRKTIALEAVAGLEYPVDKEVFEDIQDICREALSEPEQEKEGSLIYHIKFYTDSMELLPVSLNVLHSDGVRSMIRGLIPLTGVRIKKVRIHRVSENEIEYVDSVGMK